MRVILHAGAHQTDNDLLLKSLLRNREIFRREGIAVPKPSRYRRLVRDTLHAMEEGPVAPQARMVVLDSMLDTDYPARLIMSNDNFFSVPKRTVSKGMLYPRAAQKLSNFSQLFEQDNIELFFALRNPATFLSAVYAEAPEMSFVDFLDGADARELRWSELILRIRQALPWLPITVWCNEDTPLIWGDLIRAFGGMDSSAETTGDFDLLATIMSDVGLKRLRDYLDQHPQLNAKQRHRVIEAFLDKFALEEEMEEELSLPGWTPEVIEELTDIYDEDVIKIGNIQGVKLITP